jgi:pyrophosphate--fructose-6-phosphate 1-phosphotransferase
VALDKVNVGDWFSKRLTKLVGADRTLVQKSGYFARSAAANAEDRKLIREMAHVAVESALAGISGLVGHDEERGDALRAIELPRVKGGKAFDIEAAWFKEMLAAIGQPRGEPVAVSRGGED